MDSNKGLLEKNSVAGNSVIDNKWGQRGKNCQKKNYLLCQTTLTKIRQMTYNKFKKNYL